LCDTNVGWESNRKITAMSKYVLSGQETSKHV
jgi:hypothetical protein